MTIKQWIIEGTICALEERNTKLKAMSAPKVMIESIEEELARLNNQELKCGGDVSLLDAEMVDMELKTGRGGVPYYTFNGSINYFPKAKYGRFVVKVTK